MSKKQISVENPALAFFSNTAETKTDTKTETTKPATAPLIAKRERRSKRISVVLKPSDFAYIQKIAKATGNSQNEIINIAIENLIDAYKNERSK